MDGWEGYCVLPGLGDHQVFHHLPLQGQGLGKEGRSEARRLPSSSPPRPTHQRCLLHGLAGVQTGHPGLVRSLQLLILQGGLLQRCQLPGNGYKLLSGLRKAQQRSGDPWTFPDPALRPEGEEAEMGSGRRRKEGRWSEQTGDHCPAELDHECAIARTLDFAREAGPLCKSVVCLTT